MNSPGEEVSVAGLGVKAWGDVLLLHEREASPASFRCRRRTESLQVIKRRLRKSPASRRNGAGESWRGG